jgi:hypothetical protein
MKPMRTTLFLTLAAALLSAPAPAQPGNDGVPGPADYGAFSQFITDRNIFDASRQPHQSSTHRVVSRPRTHSASAPAFSLVGTMSYEKGVFAFFNGNNDDLKQALLVSGKIADYTVTKIGYGRVTLETTNQSQTIEMKVGDVMREENGSWQLAAPGEVSFGDSASNSSPTNHGAAGGGAGSASGAPPSPGDASDILKRLMERRAQENQ